MQPSCRMTLIFLHVRLQWNRSNTEAGEETSKGNSSITKNHQSPVQLTSQRFVLQMAITVSPSTISHAASAAANAKENIIKRTEIISGAKSISLSPISLATFRTGDFSEVTKSAAATSTSTVTPSHSTVIYTTLGALVLPSDNSSIKLIMLFPISVILRSPMVKQDSPTSNFNPQTTKLNHNSRNPSTASPNPKDANKWENLVTDKNNKKVIAGIIVGGILGSVIGLVEYFTCAMKRPQLSHRWLYDDTRSDPVLHDNSLEPYGLSFRGASDDKTSPEDKTQEDNAGCPSDGIPMADITPSQPSL
ncbi:LOW QUALITY PROTEIN: mucin-15 [Acridotheres tristis]